MTKRSKQTKIPRTMTQKQAKRLLKRHGWKDIPGGKHLKMVKEGWRPVTLPYNHKQPYPPGMTKGILQQAGVIGGDDGATS